MNAQRVFRLADVVRVVVIAEKEEERGSSLRGEEVGHSGSCLPSDKHHLGLFTDRKGTYLCLQQECEFVCVFCVSAKYLWLLVSSTLVVAAGFSCSQPTCCFFQLPAVVSLLLQS